MESKTRRERENYEQRSREIERTLIKKWDNNPLFFLSFFRLYLIKKMETEKGKQRLSRKRWLGVKFSFVYWLKNLVNLPGNFT